VLKFKIEPFHSSLSPWELYQEIEPASSKSFFLDSIDYRSGDQRYSYIGANPFTEITLKNRRLKVLGIDHGSYSESQFMPVMRRLLKKYYAANRNPFFTGGAVGFLGYEMAPLFDRVKFRRKPDPGTPQLYFGFFRDLWVFDHAKKRYWKVTYAVKKTENKSNRRGADENFFRLKKFKPELSKNRFESMVKKAKRYIEAGDIYQANLSQRFSFEFQGSAVKLYDALRGINPSPFASFFSLGDLKIISSSPERLVSKKGNYCETKPIAGTRRQDKNFKASRKLEAELRNNAKERAEHIMLVDLERNDLGRVCDFKSVRVEELMKVEKYSHVMHLVSKVTGKLQKGKDALDLVRAVFPGGTITGCPKIRCMEIIDELEPVKRGLYTGSIGYFGFNGDMDLNIVIRTLILQKNKGHLQVGAGIVYDSDPAREYEETLHKGAALVQALVQASL
jgi:para-aminobenzoate synthetase component I